MSSGWALDMRKAGSQLPHRTAALIPREGIVLGAINPAKNMLEDGIIAEKKTQQKSRADTRVIFGASGADTAYV